MKKSKVAVIAAAVGALSCAALVACADEKDKEGHSHEYADWAITTEPTQDAGGKVTGTCAKDGKTTEKDIPKLSDTTFWKSSTTPVTETADGSIVYTEVNEVYGISYTVPIHDWGDWEILTGDEPTSTKGGKATRVCHNHADVKDYLILKDLSDRDFWTVSPDSTAAEHGKAGKTIYVNSANDITFQVDIPPQDHDFGKWNFVKGQEPTLENDGKATRSCACGNETSVETVDVKKLSDTSVWTHETAEADYSHGGYDRYVSAYGTITISETPKIAAPYDGKTYHSFYIDAAEKVDGTISIGTSWTAAEIAFDENSEYIGTGYPFRQHTKIEITDFETCALKITETAVKTVGDELVKDPDATPVEKTGYIDLNPEANNSSAIIYPRDTSLKTFHVLVPFATEGISGKASASIWDGEHIAIGYKDAADVTHNIYITEDRVYFGVSFLGVDPGSETETAVSGGDCFTAGGHKWLYIKNADGDIIEKYGYDGTKMHALDGCEGVYALASGETAPEFGSAITLYGFGSGEVTGGAVTYEVNSGVVCVTTADGYYELTIDKTAKTFTATKPMVDITYDMKGTGENKTVSVNKNFAAALEAVENAAFLGWYTDADCTHEVELTDGKYIPTADITLYAKWSTSSFTVHFADGMTETKYFASGDSLGDLLPTYTINDDRMTGTAIDIANMKKFKGWAMTESGAVIDVTSIELTNDNNGAHFYAQWEDLPVYFGEYSGSGFSKSDTSYEHSSAALKIDIDGKVTGSVNWSGSAPRNIDGIFVSYNESTGVLIWKSADNKEHPIIVKYDSVNKERLALLPVSPSETGDVSSVFYSDTVYVVSTETDSIVQENDQIHIENVYHTGETDPVRYTHIVAYGDGKYALIHDYALYMNVTFETNLGAAVEFGAIKDQQTLVIKQGDTVVLTMGSVSKTIGSDGNNLHELDAFYGEHTIGGTVYTVNGVGTVKWTEDATEKTAVYTVADAATGKLDVFEQSEGVNTVHYVMTINGDSSTFVKEMVDLQLVKGDATRVTLHLNTLIPVTLDIPTADTEKFVGWYTDERFATPVVFNADGTYTPTADVVTLYEKWSEKVLVSVYYVYGDNAAEKQPDVEYAKDEKFEIEAPDTKRYAFDKWYSDAACTTEVGETVTGAMSAYAKYEYVPYKDDYVAGYIGTTTNGRKSITRMNSGNLVVSLGKTDADVTGKMLPFKNCTSSEWGSSWGYGGSGECKYTLTVSYDAATKVITFNTKKEEMQYSYVESTYNYVNYGYVDEESGIIIVSYSQNAHDYTGGMGIMLPSGYEIINYGYASVWNDSKMFVLDYKGADGNTHTLLFDGTANKLYADVVCRDDKGAAIAGDKVWESKYVAISTTGGTPITEIGYNDTTMVEVDDAKGTYSANGQSDMVLDGLGGFTWGDKSGTYAETDTENSYDVYVVSGGKKVEHYTLVIDRSEGSFTVTECKATVTYDLNGHGTLDSTTAEVFTGCEFTLPADLTEADGSVKFGGWFEQNDFSGSAVTALSVSADKTIYAKWNARVTITYNYLDGGTTTNKEVTSYYVGDDAAEVEKVDFKYNGLTFVGWYTKDGSADNDYGTEFTAGTELTGDITVYAKWIEAHALYGEYVGAEVYGWSESNTISGGSSGKNVTIDAVGKATGTVSGDVSSYDTETTAFTVGSRQGMADLKNGVLWVNYDSGTAATTDRDDMYIFIKDAKSFGTSSSAACYWNNVKDEKGSKAPTVLAHFTVVDKSNITSYMDVFVHNYRIYGNVTFTAKDAAGQAITDASKVYNTAATLLVYDSDGNLIQSFKAIDGKLTVAELDGMQGTYTCAEKADITLDGMGGGKCGDNAINYVKIDDTSINMYVEESGALASYLVTLDTTAEEKTYTSEKKSAAVTFTTEHGTAPAITELAVGKEIALPEITADGYRFMGWCSNADLSDEPVTTFTATAGETYAFYAKWEEIVYEVTTGDSYKWTEKNGVWSSGNYHDNGTTSTLTITANKAGTLSFDWTVSSESGYDYMYICKNGAEQAKKSGDESGKFTIDVAAGDTITVKYEKDSSGASGDDEATVANIALVVSSTPAGE